MPTASSSYLVFVAESSNRPPQPLSPPLTLSASWSVALSSPSSWQRNSATPSVVTTAAAVASTAAGVTSANSSAAAAAAVFAGTYGYYADVGGDNDAASGGGGSRDRPLGPDFESDDARSPGAAVAIALALTAITLVCLIGNLLVMVAVCLVRRLRTPSNYLIANLAVTDWLVGLLVMPWAIAYDSLGRWPFGSSLCTAWITCDVLLSTASILNLMMISVDRYLVITRPLHYAPRRGRSLMLAYAAAAWTMSVAIGLAPLVVGWRHVTHDGVCLVSQELGYQVYATVGAFYLPLAVMLALYGKVLHVSTGIAQSTLSKRRPPPPQLPHGATFASATRAPATAAVAAPDAEASALLPPKCGLCTVGSDRSTPYTDPTAVAGRPDHAAEALETRDYSSTARHCVETHLPWDDGGEDSGEGECGGGRRLGSLGLGVAASGDGGSSTPLTEHDGRAGSCSQPRLASSSGGAVLRHGRSNCRSLCDWRCWSMATLRRCRAPPHSQRTKCVGGGENRAAPSKAVVTLGIVMGGFVLFWLPFFIVALIRPFCGATCSIPLWVQSLLTWLGYVNSCLNPIVYIRFNREYRTPFKEILLLRCRTLQAEVRREDYRHRYGTLQLQRGSKPTADFPVAAAAASAASVAGATARPIVAWV